MAQCCCVLRAATALRLQLEDLKFNKLPQYLKFNKLWDRRLKSTVFKTVAGCIVDLLICASKRLLSCVSEGGRQVGLRNADGTAYQDSPGTTMYVRHVDIVLRFYMKYEQS